MTLAVIISPYNAPTSAARAANVRLGIALARWAAAQGYTPVGWWCDVDPSNPESDADPVARAAALARSAERARMVGAAGGVAVVPAFIKETEGMRVDVSAWLDGRGPWDGNRRLLLVFSEDVPPYLLPDPVPTVPRAAVQAAVDEMRDRFAGVMHSVDPHRRGIASGVSQAADIIINHTGVTPTEVTP